VAGDSLYDQQITARACYQLKRKDGPDADGYQRLSCPATPVPATARTCPTPARPGTPATPPCATPSKASTATSKWAAHQALAQPARRRVRGIAAQPVFTALLLTAANIRKIRAWRALTPDDKNTTARRARRRRSSLRDYLPDS
jgi:hypothetical protein